MRGCSKIVPEQSAVRSTWIEIGRDRAGERGELAETCYGGESRLRCVYLWLHRPTPKDRRRASPIINYLESIIERLELTSQRSFATVPRLPRLGQHGYLLFPLYRCGASSNFSRPVADAEAMADYFNRHAIDCLKIVPSHLAALHRYPTRKRVLPRQLLILGGEASDVDW
jgi:hypothetical protein